MFKWGRKKFDRITERWPKDEKGETTPPVFFQHVQGTEIDVEMAVNLLEAYGIPALRKAPGDGSFGEILLGSSGYGVDIYKKFDVESTEKLELVDTIGIGSSADSALIEEEMYRVLREDCDAAVDLFRADKTPNYPQEQTSLLDNISKKLSDRNPSKWIVYVLIK